MLDFLQVWPWVVEPNNQQGELLSQFGAVVPHNQSLGKSSHKIHILARSLNKRKKSEYFSVYILIKCSSFNMFGKVKYNICSYCHSLFFLEYNLHLFLSSSFP